MGVVFQVPEDHLFTPTVAADVAFGPANSGVRGAHLAERSPAHLSAGQRLSAALATVLACRPEILVLDEPSAHLDPAGRRELAETLMTRDTTPPIVTHDLPYTAQLGTRAVVMDAGAVVADSAINSVLADTELLARHRLELLWGFHVTKPDH